MRPDSPIARHLGAEAAYRWKMEILPGGAPRAARLQRVAERPCPGRAALARK